MAAYLRDSNYLDRLTRSLTAEVLVYNPEARAFGYWRAVFTWTRWGEIRATARAIAFPAMGAYTGGSGEAQTQE